MRAVPAPAGDRSFARLRRQDVRRRIRLSSNGVADVLRRCVQPAARSLRPTIPVHVAVRIGHARAPHLVAKNRSCPPCGLRYLKVSSMKATVLLSTLALATMTVTCARAAEPQPQPSLVSREYTDVVAPADQAAYEAGIKAYHQCLRRHGFKYTWRAWTHETGDTHSYTYRTDALLWSAFDDMQASSKACDDTLHTYVNPRLKSESSAFIEPLPAMSHRPAGGAGAASDEPIAEVNYFKLKNGHEPQETFVTVMQKVAAAAEKAHWNFYFAMSTLRDADANAPEFIMVVRSKNWGEVGRMPDTPMWSMVEKVYGKDEAQAMRKSLNEAFLYETARIDSYNAELSYQPDNQ